MKYAFVEASEVATPCARCVRALQRFTQWVLRSPEPAAQRPG